MKTSKINITFVLPTLKPHGAEKIMSFIAQNLDNNKFNSTLLIIGYEKDAGYKIKGIKLKFLNKFRVLVAVPSLFFYLIKNKPTVVMSSISHLNLVMAFLSIFFKRIKFVGREASVCSVMGLYTEKQIGIYDKLIKIGYNWLDAIVCQSQDMVDDLVQNIRINSQKLILINNPITQNNVVKSLNSTNGVKKLITVGRLSKEKGYVRILNHLSKLKFPFQYTIIGDGKEASQLLNLIEKLNLKGKVNHIANTNKVDKYLAESDLYLQGSFVEGFPNALLESCVVGTPVIAYNVPGGTKEIIQNDVNGYLVSSKEEYIDKINYSLFKKEWNPLEISNSVQKKFKKEEIIKKYEELFIQLST